MAKRVKNLFKRISNAYMKGFAQMYGPCLQCGVNPFL